MIRRNFLIFLSVLGVGFLGFMSLKSSFILSAMNKIRSRFDSVSKTAPDIVKTKAKLPEGSASISIETALNSRCTSDYDDTPSAFHWGMFDKTTSLLSEHIKQILSSARIPRFTNIQTDIEQQDNILTFTIDKKTKAPSRDWVMIENGMQQQAVGLVCAALGVGHVFNGLGVDGKSTSSDKIATVRFILGAMKPSYDDKFWSVFAPSAPAPWRSGTLPDPARHGKVSLLSALEEIDKENANGRNASIREISQLLWAARGRTPHYFLSKPWGMTIPTYRGLNSISDVSLIYRDGISKYINWQDNSPTHSLELINGIDPIINSHLFERYRPYNCFLVLSKNEKKARALWEIGYQLLNLILQAHSLDIAYKAILLSEDEKKIFNNAGIKTAAAAFLVKAEEKVAI